MQTHLVTTCCSWCKGLTERARWWRFELHCVTFYCQMLSGAGVKGWWWRVGWGGVGWGKMALKVAANTVVTQWCYSLLVLTWTGFVLTIRTSTKAQGPEVFISESECSSLSSSDEAEGGDVMWFHAAPLTLALMICIETTRQGINQKMKSISTYLIKFFVTL